MPGQDAEDASLGTAGSQLGWRRGGEEAAVAGSDGGLEDGDLAVEAEDRAVHDRHAVPHRGVVDEVARREVVGPVDDDVPAVGEDPIDVVRARGAPRTARRVTSGLSASIVARAVALSARRGTRSNGRSGAADSTRRRCRRRRSRSGRRPPRRGRAMPASRGHPRPRAARTSRAACLPGLAHLGDQQVPLVASALLRASAPCGSC